MDIFPDIHGKILDFAVIVIGHLKWNPYFHESQDAPPRGDPSTCTSTLVRGLDEAGNSYALLIDPTLRNSREEYFFDLNRRTGLHPEDITHCFTTHSHFDHVAGLNYFPDALWCASRPVMEELMDSEIIDGKRIEAVDGEFLPGISTICLPGHRNYLCGIAFELEGMKYAVTADAVMTKQHFIKETTMFEQDAALAAETIGNLKDSVDFIIPGHDNLFFSNRLEGRKYAKDISHCR